jgi:hypothetical protein
MTELNNFDYMNDYIYRDMRQRIMVDRANANNFPKNVVTVLISGLEYEAMSKNNDFKEFLKHIVEKEKSARVFELQNEELFETIPNWVSMFTGAKTELTGTSGNTFSEDLMKLDNIFRRMKTNQVENVIIGINLIILGSPELNEFLRNSISDAEIYETNTLDNKHIYNGLNLLKYADEVRFQNLMRMLNRNQKNYQHIKKQNRKYSEKITDDEYYINYFMLVHFSTFI